MKIKRQVIALTLALLQIVTLAACAEIPDSIDRDGIVVAGTNNDEDKVNDPAVPSENTSAPASKTPAEESIAIISDSNGQHIKMDVDTPAGNKLCIDAVVEADGITQISKYNYVLVPISEELRESLFAARFGNRASEFEYDELNHVWTLSNSSSVADYYLYNTYNPMAGETVPGEESFSLESTFILLGAVFGLNARSEPFRLYQLMLVFPMHTILMSGISMMLLTVCRSSKAPVFSYFAVEGCMVIGGSLFPGISKYLLPFWGMAQSEGLLLSNRGYHLLITGGMTVLVFILLTSISIKWLQSNNPAASPRNI